MTEKRVLTRASLEAAAETLARLTEALTQALAHNAEQVLCEGADSGGDSIKGLSARVEALAKTGRATALFAHAVERLGAVAPDETEDEGMDERTDGDDQSIEQERAEVHRMLDRIALIAPRPGRGGGCPIESPARPDETTLGRNGAPQPVPA